MELTSACFPRVKSQAWDVCPLAIGAARMFLIALHDRPDCQRHDTRTETAIITFCFLRRHLRSRSASSHVSGAARPFNSHLTCSPPSHNPVAGVGRRQTRLRRPMCGHGVSTWRWRRPSCLFGHWGKSGQIRRTSATGLGRRSKPINRSCPEPVPLPIDPYPRSLEPYLRL